MAHVARIRGLASIRGAAAQSARAGGVEKETPGIPMACGEEGADYVLLLVLLRYDYYVFYYVLLVLLLLFRSLLFRGACCLDVRTLTFCQRMGFPIKPLKVKLLAGKQKAICYYYYYDQYQVAIAISVILVGRRIPYCISSFGIAAKNAEQRLACLEFPVEVRQTCRHG